MELAIPKNHGRGSQYMSDDLRAQIHHGLSIKKTEELLEIWEDEELAESDQETYEIVREILAGRLGYLPSHSALQQIRQTVMNIEDFLEKGELDKAFKECDLAIQLQPDLAIAYNYRGEIHDEREELEQAMTNYQRAVQFDPELKEAWENLLSTESALEVEFQKSSTKSHLDVALAYAYEDEPQKAIEECEIARLHMPNIAIAHNYLGLILETLNQLEPAIDSYLNAIQLNPRFYAARENLANARVKLEEENYHLIAMERRNEEQETNTVEYNELEVLGILKDENPIPGWLYLDEKAFLLIGWPGYRNRPGRSGYDPLERNAEHGHMQGLMIRYLFNGKLRTRNPIYLSVMACLGLLYCTPLFLLAPIFQGRWIAISALVFLSPYWMIGILLLKNVFLSMQIDLDGEYLEDNGHTFF
jgi:tetratricopeptide (TPR) repeat protein